MVSQSLQTVLDVILGITPVPGLSAAFNTLKLIISAIQQARKRKQRLTVLAQSAAQLLQTLNAEFTQRGLLNLLLESLSEIYTGNGGGTGPTPREVETLHNMRSRQALVPQPAQGKRERILLHPQRKDRYQSFDTYSPHLVTYNGKEYPTSEHLYQAFKFMDNRPDIADGVRTISKSPKRPFSIAWRTQRTNTQIGRE
ncbi:hypothetical protein B0H13DRAFT_2394022 [Mycena leptocephala]|nr:hypothetical protein B0H13DRAFT_2394022 [Mycena leptocephala]